MNRLAALAALPVVLVLGGSAADVSFDYHYGFGCSDHRERDGGGYVAKFHVDTESDSAAWMRASVWWPTGDGGTVRDERLVLVPAGETVRFSLSVPASADVGGLCDGTVDRA